MPLPFLPNKKKQSGIIVHERQPDQKDDEDHSGIDACAQDILRAIEQKDPKHLGEALRAAFAIMESEPHDEAEHIEPHSYEAQNIKIGEQE